MALLMSITNSQSQALGSFSKEENLRGWPRTRNHILAQARGLLLTGQFSSPPTSHTPSISATRSLPHSIFSSSGLSIPSLPQHLNYSCKKGAPCWRQGERTLHAGPGEPTGLREQEGSLFSGVQDSQENRLSQDTLC